ncbi:MAG: M28 family peptidase [Ignavibacteria bacterium]|jgi:aminopeptidase YwaD|nr:M28 family peptidase [Ignavibacteria bacterium]MCU7502733.1 M28 family peptidase [Ignavibacteria bacterium]MCU7517338.1 M28 family peptidase [Ignavibacteria bacterium]
MGKGSSEEKCLKYLNILCNEITGRSVGSRGNRQATEFFENEISSFGWKTFRQEFDAIDWKEDGAVLTACGSEFCAFPSPYSNGCEVEAELSAVSTVGELEKLDGRGKIILLHGEIAKEQIMPKNFVFYNPEEHKKIVSLLEKSGAETLICATGRNSSLAGGLYPFPLIEDGDFDLPSVFTTDAEGERLLNFRGREVYLHSNCRRAASKGYNISARKGAEGSSRIVVTAHIDAKQGTPGAIDNATGVAVLLLLASLLKDYKGEKEIEIVAFNGEDYYAVPGQMKYIEKNLGQFEKISLEINIDGAGYIEGDSAYSFYNVPEELIRKAESVFSGFEGLRRGVSWPQGDHSIFVQFGCPAVALSSKWLTDNMDKQDITHTKKDNLEIVDPGKLVTLSEALMKLIMAI